MLYGRAVTLCVVSAIAFLSFRANAQSVISTRSGVIHYFEGTVYLGGQPLQYRPGKFSIMQNGADLRTEQGYAEVLLTPGVFVRIGEQSAIRMVDNGLLHTRVELIAGSAVVDSAEPNAGTAVTLTCKNWGVRFLERGIYRIDSAPPHLWVLEGSAEVSAGVHEGAILVDKDMDLPLAPVLVPEQTVNAPHDALTAWAGGRHQSISADNTIAADIQDPANLNTAGPGAGGFTYFPMLGVPPMWNDIANAYGSFESPQPGFNSLYLPGYAFLPLLIGLRGGSSSIGSPPNRFPLHPTPVFPISPRPVPIHPVSPTPTAVRPAPPVAIHGGIHR
jgi:hypothetical protein